MTENDPKLPVTDLPSGIFTHSLHFDSEQLETPLLQCDSVTAALCIEKCEHLKARLQVEYDIVDDVREILLSRPGFFPNIEFVAERLNVSARTLRRRLAANNSGYQQIIDTIRYQLAREYLSSTDLGIEQISTLLGYSDPANFSHAFRRWAGVAPLYFRQGGSGQVLT